MRGAILIIIFTFGYRPRASRWVGRHVHTMAAVFYGLGTQLFCMTGRMGKRYSGGRRGGQAKGKAIPAYRYTFDVATLRGEGEAKAAPVRRLWSGQAASTLGISVSILTRVTGKRSTSTGRFR